MIDVLFCLCAYTSAGRLLSDSSSSSYAYFLATRSILDSFGILNTLEMLSDICFQIMVFLVHRSLLLYLIESSTYESRDSVVSQVAFAVVKFVVIVIVRQSHRLWARFSLSPL